MTRLVISGLAALVAAIGGGTSFAQQSKPSDETILVVTALSPECSITLGEEPATVGSTAGLYAGEPLAVEVKGGVRDARETMLRIDVLATNILAVRTILELEIDESRGLAIRPQLGADGMLDIYHEVDSPPLTVLVGPAAVRLGRGVLRVRAAGEGQVQIVCGSGSASVSSAAAKFELNSTGKNSAMLRGTSLSEPARVETAGEMAATLSRVVQQSLMRDLVRVAESAAEGDIEPPARGSAVPIAVIATAVRVADIVPRGGGPTSFSGSSGQSSSVATQGGSTAEAFLTSGQAALAVVGARIQGTRIVGGTAGSAPLGVNNQFRRRFTLGAVNKVARQPGPAGPGN